MFNLITGRAGYGKSYYIKEQIGKLLDNNNEDIVLIIPEQSSFTQEKALLRQFGPKKASQVEIFSFTRLAHKLCEQYGGTLKDTVDTFGKIMIMSRALHTVSHQLKLYFRQVGSIPFIKAMLSIISEFKNNGIYPDNLSILNAKLPDGVLKQKINEISLIYSVYDTILNEKYRDPQDDLQHLNNILKQNDYFKNKHVFIDGFKGFTYTEFEIISQIMKKAEDTNISLCIDPDEIYKNNNYNLFSSVAQTARCLINIAKKNGMTGVNLIKLKTPYRFKSEDLKHLEKMIFNPYSSSVLDKPDNICIYCASSAYDESEYIARTIRKLIIQGYRYRDMVIIARDISQYEGILDVMLKKYDIPCFMDKREQIDCTPLFSFILSSLEIAANGFDSDLIFRFIKTGLTNLAVEDISELENYTLTWNISGNQWTKPFNKHPDGYGKQMDADSLQKLDKINELREFVIMPLIDFRESCKDATGKQISEAVYNLLIQYNVPEILKETAFSKITVSDTKIQTNNYTSAEETDRLWTMAIDLLETAYDISGNEYINIKEYTEMLRLAVSSANLGHIPMSLDCVSAGSADRIRPNEPKITFILGANDGIFPANMVNSSLLSDFDRDTLIQYDVDFSDNYEMQSANELLLAYLALTSASEKLYICMQKINLKGEVMLPSSIITQTEKIFPDINVISSLSQPQDIIWSDIPAFELTAKLYNQNTPFSASLKQYFSHRSDFSRKYDLLKQAASNKNYTIKNKDKTKQLFGKDIYLSASRIETYHSCRYQYFCKYGLNAKSRPKAQLDGGHYGTMLHYVMENLIKDCGRDKLINIPAHDRNQIVDNLINQYIKIYMGGMDDKSARFSALVQRWSNNCKLIAAQITHELKQSLYIPIDFELKIGDDIPAFKINLPDGGSINIIGSVDRVDIMKASDNTNYLRVIDYKSGQQDFNLSGILDGLNMQMLIYLLSIWENGKGRYGDIIPSGVLYMPSAAACVFNESADEEQILKILASNLKMKGMLLDDTSSILGMEKDGSGKIIPLSLDSEGQIKLTKQNINTVPYYSIEELKCIELWIKDILIKMAENLKNGQVAPDPIQKGRYASCKFCDYKSICSWDDTNIRQPNDMTFRSVMENLKKLENDDKKGGGSNEQ